LGSNFFKLRYYGIRVEDLQPTLVDLGMRNRNWVYQYFNAKFKTLPLVVKEHREYFGEQKRGYGENAFHAFWFQFFSENKVNK
jgi:hypothetical protein